MRKVIIVHGIHTHESNTWMDELASLFHEAGFPTLVWTYGYAYALLTRWQNPGRARELSKLIATGDLVLGHSNGGALTWMAGELGSRIGGAILLNPALDRDKVLSSLVPWVNLYPNRYDKAVKLSGLLPAHPWGAQGRDGLSVHDERYLTRFTDEMGPGGELPLAGHSAIISPEGISAWGRRLVQDVQDRLV